MDAAPALWLYVVLALVGATAVGLLLREPLRRVQMIGRPIAWPTIIVGLLLLGVGHLADSAPVDIVGWVVLYFGLLFKSRWSGRWFGR